jgi:hypothetical protein
MNKRALWATLLAAAVAGVGGMWVLNRPREMPPRSIDRVSAARAAEHRANVRPAQRRIAASVPGGAPSAPSKNDDDDTLDREPTIMEVDAVRQFIRAVESKKLTPEDEQAIEELQKSTGLSIADIVKALKEKFAAVPVFAAEIPLDQARTVLSAADLAFFSRPEEPGVITKVRLMKQNPAIQPLPWVVSFDGQEFLMQRPSCSPDALCSTMGVEDTTHDQLHLGWDPKTGALHGHVWHQAEGSPLVVFHQRQGDSAAVIVVDYKPIESPYAGADMTSVPLLVGAEIPAAQASAVLSPFQLKRISQPFFDGASVRIIKLNRLAVRSKVINFDGEDFISRSGAMCSLNFPACSWHGEGRAPGRYDTLELHWPTNMPPGLSGQVRYSNRPDLSAMISSFDDIATILKPKPRVASVEPPQYSQAARSMSSSYCSKTTCGAYVEVSCHPETDGPVWYLKPDDQQVVALCAQVGVFPSGATSPPREWKACVDAKAKR